MPHKLTQDVRNFLSHIIYNNCMKAQEIKDLLYPWYLKKLVPFLENFQAWLVMYIPHYTRIHTYTNTVM